MNGTPNAKQLFLLGQRLSELTGVDDADERRFHICGGVDNEKPPPERRQPNRNPWEPCERQAVRRQAGERNPSKRVGLLCDAGLGKTTNIEWLAAGIAEDRGSRQVPVLLRLHDSEALDRLEEEFENPNSLLDFLAAEVQRAAHGQAGRHQQALKRLQATGRITLLIDGLDHALSRRNVPQRLAKMLASVQWQNCPVWVSGRPYAFEAGWHALFREPSWKFLRVEPLAEPEIRFYMGWNLGKDYYDIFPPESRVLLAVPRLLRLICGIIARAIHRGAAAGISAAQAVKQLDLRTPADVYYRAYFDKGDYGDRDSQGLLAQGLIGDAERIGLAKEVDPTEMNFERRIRRVGVVLGAIAFHMFAMNSNAKRPEPTTTGVGLDPLQAEVAARLESAGERTLADFQRDLDLVRKMNNGTLEFLIFRELDDKRLHWHDRTVQAFFAAYWAMTFGTAKDRNDMQRWIVDSNGKALDAFDDFWTFAAELPDALVEKERWLEVFSASYVAPQKLQGNDYPVQWHRRMIYHTFRRMQARSQETIGGWQQSFLALKKGAPDQVRIFNEIEDGFRDIPAGACHYGADPLDHQPGMERYVAPFRMHQWPVTNEMYERFDPSHRQDRWLGTHPLAGKRGKEGEDHCPVVHVTFFDAWCFAAWCGHRLPTELEWEHACRAGSKDAWYFGNEETDLEKYAWYAKNSQRSTHPVGLKEMNGNELYDMHGNVWEWCEDRYAPGASPRLLRGGSWILNGRVCRSAFRLRGVPDYRYPFYGFRLAAVPDVGAK